MSTSLLLYWATFKCLLMPLMQPQKLNWYFRPSFPRNSMNLDTWDEFVKFAWAGEQTWALFVILHLFSLALLLSSSGSRNMLS